MTTMAQQTSVGVYELRKKIAEAVGVAVEHVSVRVSSGSEGEWTEVDATIQIWNG